MQFNLYPSEHDPPAGRQSPHTKGVETLQYNSTNSRCCSIHTHAALQGATACFSRAYTPTSFSQMLYSRIISLAITIYNKICTCILGLWKLKNRRLVTNPFLAPHPSPAPRLCTMPKRQAPTSQQTKKLLKDHKIVVAPRPNLHAGLVSAEQVDKSPGISLLTAGHGERDREIRHNQELPPSTRCVTLVR